VHLIEVYLLNLKTIMVMQQLGCGKAGGTIIGRLLLICNGPMSGTWTKIEGENGKAQIQLGKKIISKNVCE
jgi:hypothetical protein